MRDSGSAARAHNPPAEHPGVAARASRKDVVVFTSDDEFLLTLGPAMDDRYRSRPTDGTGAWTEALRGRSGVALIDAATLTNAPELVRTIEAEFPAFAIAVVAPGAAHPQWSLALSRGSIARLLDRDTLSNETIATALEMEPRAASAEAQPRAGATSNDGSSGRRRIALIGGTALAVLAIAGAAWMWLGGKDAAPAPHSTTAAQATAPDGGSVTAVAAPAVAQAPGALPVPELLSAARVAFAERHYVEPAGNNALELYARVLGVEAGNAEALDGVRRVITVAATQLQSQIKAGELDDASTLLDTLRAAAPDDADVVALGQVLAAARPKWLVARAREAIAADQYATAERLIDEIATLSADRATVQDLRRSLDARRKDAELARAVAAARASLTAGSLLDSSPDGPRARLAALQKMDRKDAQVVAFQREYQTALTRSARDATRSADFAAAERLLAAAADAGSSRDIADARKELQAARDNAAAREQQRAAAASQHAQQEAAQVAAAPPPKMPKARKRTAPKYPAAAERAGIEGSVTVEFGLTPEGHTRDIRVVQSTPPEIFDEAASDAVRAWRFEAVSAEDAARLPRSSVRLSFRLGDRK
ncbi:MAG TPA: energy transducer TonB [Steroidobacteraceae bacterium]|mgnify:FL=1|nr:energy transducer TonB [Steroidobacteraceae bacterium]